MCERDGETEREKRRKFYGIMVIFHEIFMALILLLPFIHALSIFVMMPK
jgi:hypothetical protein